MEHASGTRRAFLFAFSFAAAILLLGAASGATSRPYIELLRWVTTFSALLVAGLSFLWKREWPIIPFLFLAALFNPLVPVGLSRDIWGPIDVVAALVFSVAGVLVRAPGQPVIPVFLRSRRLWLSVGLVAIVLAVGSGSLAAWDAHRQRLEAERIEAFYADRAERTRLEPTMVEAEENCLHAAAYTHRQVLFLKEKIEAMRADCAQVGNIGEGTLRQSSWSAPWLLWVEGSGGWRLYDATGSRVSSSEGAR